MQPARSITRLWEFFLGSWTFQRQIQSTSTGIAIARLHDATADWEPTKEEKKMLYSERGEIEHLGEGAASAVRMEVTRQYLYGFEDEESVDVWFWQPGANDHLKFFHRFELRGGARELLGSMSYSDGCRRSCFCRAPMC